MNLFVNILLAIIFWRSFDCAVLIADFAMEKMIELQGRSPYCTIYTDRGDIQRMLLSADPKRTRQVPIDSVIALENVCNEADETTNGLIQGGFFFIYPGTKWCGPGNIAANFSDLGSRYREEDKCCREHDHCSNILTPGQCQRGLCNNFSTVTRSHCDCDQRLRKCLQNVKTETGNTLGAMFFNVIQVTCFRERRCTIYQTLGGLCDYEYHNAEPFFLKNSNNNYGQYDSNNNIIINNNIRQESLSDKKIESRSFDNLITINQIQMDSVRLVAKNIFNEAIIRPVNGIVNFARLFGNIWSSDSRNGYNLTMSEMICAKWKFQPSEKYVSIIPPNFHH